MKELKNSILLGLFVAIITFFFLFGIISFVNDKKDVDYLCTFIYYNEDDGNNGQLQVDYWKIEKDSTIVEIHKIDGSIWLIDSTKVKMLCVEME